MNIVEIDTGLDIQRFEKVTFESGDFVYAILPVPFEKAKEVLCKVIADMGGQCGIHATWPEWHKARAGNIIYLTKRVLAKLECPDIGEDAKRLLWDAYTAGWYGQRLYLVKNEAVAKSGKASHTAAKKKGRKAKPNTLREYLDRNMDGWDVRANWKTNRPQIVEHAEECLPDKTKHEISEKVSKLIPFLK